MLHATERESSSDFRAASRAATESAQTNSEKIEIAWEGTAERLVKLASNHPFQALLGVITLFFRSYVARKRSLTDIITEDRKGS
jgi:hypothetical protein